MKYNDELLEKAIIQSLANMSLEEDFLPIYDIDLVKEKILGDEKNGSVGRLSLTRDSNIKK